MSEQTRDEQIRTRARESAKEVKEAVLVIASTRPIRKPETIIESALRSLAATVEQETREQDAPYMKHQHGCRSIWEPEHVCGLTGYNRMIDPPCPGCVGPQRIVGCTCGLSAIRQQGQEDR